MNYLDYLNEHFRVRRTKEEKKAFRNYILEEVNKQGKLTAKVETTKDKKNENIVIGDPLTARVVCTAHYDTPAWAPFPNIMIPRNKLMLWVTQFIPIIGLLAVSLGIPYAIHAFHPLDTRQILLIFLILYYGVYFALFRGRKNPNNFNDNTSGVAAILSILMAQDAGCIENIAFILFDNEEKGKKGSKAYMSDHFKEMQHKFVLNFDCIANGEHLVFIAMEKAETRAEYELLQKSFCSNETFQTHFYPSKTSNSNSDHKNFPCGVGCEACKQTKGGMLYTPLIHTAKDVVAKKENIDFITGCIQRFFASL